MVSYGAERIYHEIIFQGNLIVVWPEDGKVSTPILDTVESPMHLKNLSSKVPARILILKHS